ncbi:unnamed protein product [Caenorhabditis angaria]|uniref:C-type lectin domain-containing protein n=1 Tax=Caenorhabditis angaria TaxID=860376 RepID=A0A9P1J545_9PELO|nr:unnamed protein product [Caenorhabditis angaria]
MKYLTLLIVLVASVFAANQCPDLDISWQNQCFYYDKLRGTFDDSNDACVRAGYHFAKIYNMIENRAIQDFAVEKLDSDFEYYWVGASNRGGNWTWTDGSPLNFTNWRDRTPSETNQCLGIMMSTGKWVPRDCSEKYQSVCAVDANVGPTPSGTCPPCPACV